MKINPIDVLLWTFRRNESDVVNLYNSLSSLMQVSTGGNMLNFGYWDKDVSNPYEAQTRLCNVVSDISGFQSAKNILDVGSGFCEPDIIWAKEFPHAKFTCLNVNIKQLDHASAFLNQNPSRIENNSIQKSHLRLVNATATNMPLVSKSVDRVVALESAQHFRPLSQFISECKRVLSKHGILSLAIPVVSDARKAQEVFNLGILSFTWASEHYKLYKIQKTITTNGFHINNLELIGHKVYEPLANYYIEKREAIKTRILQKYPPYVEKILFRSLIKMREVSRNDLINYALITCTAD